MKRAIEKIFSKAEDVIYSFLDFLVIAGFVVVLAAAVIVFVLEDIFGPDDTCT
jgi:hypothetical protein